MGIVSATHAAVTVSWKQDGADVIASWSGTLNVDSGLATDSVRNDAPASDGGGLQDRNCFILRSGVNNGFYDSEVGSASVVQVPNTSTTVPVPVSFGFSEATLYWNDVHITGGTVGAVSELTFDPSRDVIRFSGQSLVGMNVESFSNTLAWTAITTGDTISYTTVPEPSGMLLGGMGTLFLLVRRRKASHDATPTPASKQDG